MRSVCLIELEKFSYVTSEIVGAAILVQKIICKERVLRIISLFFFTRKL